MCIKTQSIKYWRTLSETYFLVILTSISSLSPSMYFIVYMQSRGGQFSQIGNWHIAIVEFRHSKLLLLETFLKFWVFHRLFMFLKFFLVCVFLFTVIFFSNPKFESKHLQKTGFKIFKRTCRIIIITKNGLSLYLQEKINARTKWT